MKLMCCNLGLERKIVVAIKCVNFECVYVMVKISMSSRLAMHE